MAPAVRRRGVSCRTGPVQENEMRTLQYYLAHFAPPVLESGQSGKKG